MPEEQTVHGSSVHSLFVEWPTISLAFEENGVTFLIDFVSIELSLSEPFLSFLWALSLKRTAFTAAWKSGVRSMVPF